MSHPLLLRLGALSAIGFLILGFAALAILNARAASERVRRRIRAAILPHLPTAPEQRVQIFRRAEGGRLARFGRKARWLIAFDPARRDQYPLPWWAVVMVALVLARGAQGLLASLLGPLSLAITPLLAVLLCRSFFRWCHARGSRALFRQMPDALAMIVRSVRVGIPMSEAIRTVGREAPQPTAREFTLLSERMMIGIALEDALREMANRNDLAEYRFFATALSLQSQTGGDLTETLENLADVIRKRVALRARGHALASEARTSAGVLVALPIFSGGVIGILNPAYIGKLFVTASGQKLFGAAVVSLSIGLLVMRSILHRSLS